MASVVAVAPTRWRARHHELSSLPLLVQLVDGFLMLVGKHPAGGRFSTWPGQSAPSAGTRRATIGGCTRLTRGRFLSPWELLKANATLPGLVKFSSASKGELYLRSEIPVLAESNLPLRLVQACRGFASALDPTRVHGENGNDGAMEAASLDIAGLIDAAGWQCSSRRGDRCAVPLETRRGARTALITGVGGMVRAWTELVSWDSLSKRCHKGLSALLMSANGRVRVTRVMIAEDESGGAAELEVVLQGPATAAELRVALEALSVGVEVCAPMAELLQEEAAAELFLAIRGEPGASEDTEP
jgi:hypothetical protein